MPVTVLRLSHRHSRDKRVSTHCGLVARAFGAEGLTYSGDRDPEMEASLRKVSEQWGGPFRVSYAASWREALRGFRGKTVHLTMYGLPLQDSIAEIRRCGDLMVIIGGEKVPGEVYRRAGWNVAVTGQPHSEVAALAVFLHEYFRGGELGKRFTGARKAVVPQERGKKVIEAQALHHGT
jgi:tRNA (cytidine56-2'-O)-methyltransferase